jgi:hypothetical protein
MQDSLEGFGFKGVKTLEAKITVLINCVHAEMMI